MQSDGDVPDPPGKPEAYDWDCTHVDLTWARPMSDGGRRIEGYIIQKKAKGTSTWLDCNKVRDGKRSLDIPHS